MLGPTQLAKAFGVSRQMIYQYEREGKLPARVDGGWDLAEVQKRLSETLGSKRGGVPKRGVPEAVEDKPKAAPKPKKVRDISAPAEQPIPEAINPEDLEKFTKADLEKAVLAHRAEKMRLGIEKIRGELVSAEEVRQAQTERAMAMREAMLNWPARVSAGIAAQLGIAERELSAVLEVEIHKLLEECAAHPVDQSKAA